jgi:hypothetical protein
MDFYKLLCSFQKKQTATYFGKVANTTLRSFPKNQIFPYFCIDKSSAKTRAHIHLIQLQNSQRHKQAAGRKRFFS